MARSMTGFGKAATEVNGEIISVEVSSVNHRFLDSSFRLPSCWLVLECALRETLKDQVFRGKVNVYVGRKRGSESSQCVILDTQVAQQYILAAQQLADLMNSTQALSLDVLAQLDGVFFQEEREDDLEQVRTTLNTLLGDALSQMNAMRENEGRALVREIRERIAIMRGAIVEIEKRLPELTQRLAERLRARVRELNADAGVTEDRLAVELALIADKTDVTEELVRLKTHLDHAVAQLDADGPMGRELTFLSQEIQREANTLGSKLRDVEVVREVLSLKSELEKLREQVQNLE